MAEAIVTIIMLAIYLFPALMAAAIQHPHVMAIFVLNLTLGWTAIGWIIALVWMCIPFSDIRNKANN